MIEINPDESIDGNPGFGGSDMIASTNKLFNRLEQERSDKVDTEEYLKALLMDN